MDENINDNMNIKDTQIERKLHERTCPYCKQSYQTQIGVDNWKKLFRKPTMDDWILLIILALIILSAFAYTTETKACKDTLKNIDTVCMQRQKNLLNSSNDINSLNGLNLSMSNASG